MDFGGVLPRVVARGNIDISVIPVLSAGKQIVKQLYHLQMRQMAANYIIIRHLMVEIPKHVYLHALLVKSN